MRWRGLLTAWRRAKLEPSGFWQRSTHGFDTWRCLRNAMIALLRASIQADPLADRHEVMVGFPTYWDGWLQPKSRSELPRCTLAFRRIPDKWLDLWVPEAICGGEVVWPSEETPRYMTIGDTIGSNDITSATEAALNAMRTYVNEHYGDQST